MPLTMLWRRSIVNLLRRYLPSPTRPMAMETSIECLFLIRPLSVVIHFHVSIRNREASLPVAADQIAVHREATRSMSAVPWPIISGWDLTCC